MRMTAQLGSILLLNRCQLWLRCLLVRRSGRYRTRPAPGFLAFLVAAETQKNIAWDCMNQTSCVGALWKGAHEVPARSAEKFTIVDEDKEVPFCVPLPWPTGLHGQTHQEVDQRVGHRRDVRVSYC